MISYSIFIVDDEETIREGLALSLETEYQAKAFQDAESAIEEIAQGPPDLVLLDIGLPGMSGIEALDKIKKQHPDLPVIMITAHEDIGTVVTAMKAGAHDYIVKPIQMEGLEVTIRNVLETNRLRKEVRMLQEKHIRENLPCFIGESDTIQDMMVFLAKVAESPDTPILILGETGTGKELIAGAIHHRSPNFRGNFVAVNCAAIPKDLIESEIFGYAEGAFSGASHAGKKGLIEDSANGTLFLDEIGDLSLEAQAKLLRFLEKGEFYRVGSTAKQQVQTRVVSATNKDLDKMIEDGLFRKDLFFRIGVIRLEVPSLGERRDDIIPLAKYFLKEFSQKFDKPFTGISIQAETAFLDHEWTGNVRELKNIIERGVLVGKGSLLMLTDLGFDNVKIAPEEDMQRLGFPSIPPEGIDLASLQRDFEAYYINQAFRMADGNESKAAKLLNLNHHTYRYRRKKLS